MRLVIFSPYFRNGINPRRIRLDNMVAGLKNKCPLLIFTQGHTRTKEEGIKVLSFGNSVFVNSNPEGVQKKSIIRFFLKKICWPDVFVFNALLYFIYYLIFERRKEDIIYTVSNPFSMHLVGLLHGIIYGNIWIADIGDSYSHNPNNVHKESMLKKISSKFEKVVLRKTFAIVVNSEALKSYYVDEWNINSNKIKVISNGIRIRAENITNIKSNKIILSYIGNTYENIREGIAETKLLLEIMKIRDNVNVHLVGETYFSLYTYIQHTDFAERFHFSKAFTLDELEYAYSQSNFLVLFGNRNYVNCASKLEEYLASKKPILFFYYDKNDLLKYSELPEDGILFVHNYDWDTDKILQFIDSHIGFVRKSISTRNNGAWEEIIRISG